MHLHGYQPPDRVAEFLRDKADLGIVSLAPGVIRAAYPSKTMSYLRQGCAVMVLVEAESELARTMTSAEAGFHSDPSDAGELAERLRKLAERRADLADAGERAQALYRSQFNPERQLALWRASSRASKRSGPHELRAPASVTSIWSVASLPRWHSLR